MKLNYYNTVDLLTFYAFFKVIASNCWLQAHSVLLFCSLSIAHIWLFGCKVYLVYNFKTSQSFGFACMQLYYCTFAV